MTSTTVNRAIEMDQDQAAAVAAVGSWLSRRLVDPKVPQMFRVGGPAGSGKTTVIKEILERHRDLDVAVTTLTGKASQVLRDKGVDTAINLHQLFYRPDPDIMPRKQEVDRLLQGVTDPQEVRTLRLESQQLAKTMHVRVPEIGHELIIVDEASMISGRVAEDILQFGRPVLAVGDPMQLPPVESSYGLPPLFADRFPDKLLMGNHRSNDDLVGRVVNAARAGRGLPTEAIVGTDRRDIDLRDYDVILVASKTRRWEVISELRQAQGKPTTRPVVGDEIMLWKNAHDHGLFNGSTAVIMDMEYGETKDEFRALFDDGSWHTVALAGFQSQAALAKEEADWKKRKRRLVASYADVLTVHKAQGSEWSRVLVADQWGGKDLDMKQRWRYTAVTRARDLVHVVGAEFGVPVA
ncbi:ATP-dependent RecD-like DNA helicase [Pseudonocardia sp. ICBG162]|uniref:ATP-dependent DNA helicase n=1 Tax=Pseudonocardia sp. ICBG162 TaxID=2846761 RepID=UPI001CF6AD93|nr:AAA family ATPase [Pseudonocardia sp. ICBG162]